MYVALTLSALRLRSSTLRLRPSTPLRTNSSQRLTGRDLRSELSDRRRRMGSTSLQRATARVAPTNTNTEYFFKIWSHLRRLLGIGFLFATSRSSLWDFCFYMSLRQAQRPMEPKETRCIASLQSATARDCPYDYNYFGRFATANARGEPPLQIQNKYFITIGRTKGDVRVVRLYGKSEMGEHIGSPLQIPIYLRTFAEYFNVI